MSGWVIVDPFTIAIHLNRFLVKDMGSEVSSRSSSCSTPEKIKNNTKEQVSLQKSGCCFSCSYIY